MVTEIKYRVRIITLSTILVAEVKFDTNYTVKVYD